MGKYNNATRKTLLIISILILGLLISLSSFAWYQVGNRKSTSITVQAYDDYKYYIDNVTSTDTNALLIATQGKANNQADGTLASANAAGDMEYISLKVDFTVENISGGAKKFEFEVAGFDAYESAASAAPSNESNDGKSGQFTYNGTIYYYQGSAVYTDSDYKTVASDLLYDSTLKMVYTKVTDTFLLDMLANDLIFQFAPSDDGPALYTDKNDNTKTTIAWSVAGAGTKVYLDAAESGSLKLNVAFAVIDDAIDPAYVGLKFKFNVKMLPVTA